VSEPAISGARTLHRRIRADLETPIRAGAWARGFRIPTERDLMARYGCARMTVSRAIASLVQAGLVERRKRAGSFVARPHLQTAVLQIPDIAALITDRGESYRFQRLSRRIRPASPDDWEESSSGLSGEVLALWGLHFASGTPLAVERRVINLAAVPEARTLSFQAESPGSWLLKHVSWSEAQHRITAVNPNAETARRLGIRPGLACLSVERRTWRAGEWITVVRQIFPGNRYDLVAAFGP